MKTEREHGSSSLLSDRSQERTAVRQPREESRQARGQSAPNSRSEEAAFVFRLEELTVVVNFRRSPQPTVITASNGQLNAVPRPLIEAGLTIKHSSHGGASNTQPAEKRKK